MRFPVRFPAAALLIPHLILPASAAAAAFAPSPYGPAREPPRPNPGPCRSSSFPLPSARTTTTTTTTTTTDADGRAALDLWWDEQSRRRPTGLDDVDCGRAPDPAATCGAGWGSRLAPGRRQRQIREEARAEAQREGNAFDAWWEGRADAGEPGAPAERTRGKVEEEGDGEKVARCPLLPPPGRTRRAWRRCFPSSPGCPWRSS